MLLSIILWVCAALLISNTIYVSVHAPLNFGTFIMWCISALLVCCTVFHKPLRAFCASDVGRVLKYILISGLIFFISMLAFVALSGYSNRATNDEKVLIVLGSSLQRDGSVGGILAARLDTAACAWRQNPDIIIIVSGGVSAKGPEPEAAAMRRYLIEHHNIPQVQIYIEDHSVSTQQNFLYSKQLMMQHRIDTAQPIAFVTNTFHAWRARFFARQAGFANMRCLPAPTPPLYLLIAYFREVFAVLFTWVFRRGI